MICVLIVIPSAERRRERSLNHDDAFGAQFENALVDLTRTLEGPSGINAILVPWREDTRALIAVAAMDAAPSFDPEEADRRGERQSRLIPYRATDHDADPADDVFWQASHLALGRHGMPSLATAIQRYRPRYVIMLGDSPQSDALRLNVLELDATVLTFSSLAEPGQLAAALGLPTDRIVDLEVNILRKVEDHVPRDGVELEHQAEAGLEPFIPFGLLIQESLSDLLFPEEIRVGE